MAELAMKVFKRVWPDITGAVCWLIKISIKLGGFYLIIKLSLWHTDDPDNERIIVFLIFFTLFMMALSEITSELIGIRKALEKRK